MTDPHPPAAIHVGRRPLYDRNLDVVAYQLVAGRQGTGGLADLFVGTMVDIGLDKLASGHDAIVPLPADLLLSDGATHLPWDRLIIDLPADTPADLIGHLTGSRASDLRWRIPDPAGHPRLAPLADGAAIVAVDVSTMSAADRRRRLADLRSVYDAQIEAADVTDRRVHDSCIAAGYDLLSGTVLSQPERLSGRRLSSERLTLLRLVSLLSDPDATVDEVESAVAASPTLTYQVLRYVNSAHVGLRTEVESVRTAVTLLGPPLLRQLASVLMAVQTTDRPQETTRVALTRAEACAALAESLGRPPAVYRTVGLLSAVDLLLGCELATAIADLPLPDDVVAALLQHEGEPGRVLRAVRHYADCNWDDQVLASYDAAMITDAYFTGVSRADELLTVATTSSA